MKRFIYLTMALVALAMSSVTVSAQTIRQQKLFLDDGSGNITTIQGSGAGTLTLPTSGTLLTTTSTIPSTATWNGTLISPTYGGTGVNNGTKTLTLGGNMTTTGAFTLGLTTTANTSVTLPTSGTLATTTSPGMAIAWGVYDAATNTYQSSYNCGTPSAGSGPFYTVPIASGGGSFTNYTVVVTWYGGVGSNMGAVSGNLAGWSDGTYIYFADYLSGGSQVTPASFVSFVLYAR